MNNKLLASNTEPQGVTFTDLDPILGSLGQLIGLLYSSDNSTYTLNPDWFKDPVASTKSGVTENPEQFSALLAQMLGEAGGNALGIPVQDPALLGTWYPIMYQGEPTGLYIVSYQKTEIEAGQASTFTAIGLGVLHSWQVTPSNPLLDVKVWGLVPFLKLGNGSLEMTFSSPGYPLSIGVAAEGTTPGQPLVDINGVSFNGVKASLAVDLAVSNPFDLSLQIINLKLPGQPKGTTRSLADLAAISGQEILDTAASLFVGALSDVFPSQQKRIHYLAPLFGFSSQVPSSDVKMPVLEWYSLFSIASSPDGDVKQPFISWFNTLCADPKQLNAWLGCLAGFLGNDTPTIAGNGSRSNPFEVPLLSVDSVGQLNFNAATTVSDTGIRYFYPGLGFKANGVSLGTSDAVFNMGASLELGEFVLTTGSASVTPQIQFDFSFELANKTSGTPLIAYGDYSFGSLAAGLQLGSKGQLVPRFVLNEVKTPDTSFDAINVLSPGQLADAGASALSSALKSLLDIPQQPQQTFQERVGALIGLITPDSAGADWPDTLAPPFSPAKMAGSLINPLEAWANYYLETLRYGETIQGKSAFTYLVNEFAAMLQCGSEQVQIVVSGDGTPASPWQAGVSLDDQTLPAYFTAWQEATADAGLRLVLGLALAPEITVASTEIVPSLTLDALSLDFPPTGKTARVTANWLPQVAARLTLPNGFSTPPVGGFSVQVSATQLSAVWSRFSGWSWSMFVNDPAITVAGNPIALGQNLNFSDQTSLKDLVTTGQAAFAPFLVAALGTLLIRSETRAGLFVAGALGLSADLSDSPIFPAGLTWKDFTTFDLKSFTDPWPDLRRQIASDFSTTDKAKSVLSLLSWTILDYTSAAPKIAGTGTFADPYITPLPGGFMLPLWYAAEGEVLGMGIGRTDSYSFIRQVGEEKKTNRISFQLISRLNLVEYSLSSGSLVHNGQLPSLSFKGTLSNPDGLLIDLPQSIGSVAEIAIGFDLSLSGGSVSFVPVVTLRGVTLPGQAKQDAITLQDFLASDFTASSQSAFLVLLNAGLQEAFAQTGGSPTFQTLYTVLETLGLTLAREKDTDPYAIDAAGWSVMLADFDTFIQTQLSQLLASQDSRRQLFDLLGQLLHVNFPDFPEPLLDLLEGLQICGPAEKGYPIYPEAVLELMSDPVGGLKERFTNLFEDAAALSKLTAAITQNFDQQRYGNFTFSSTSNGVAAFQVLPADAFALGDFLRISGGITVDLVNRTLNWTLDSYCPKVGLTLASVLGLTYANNAVEANFGTSLVWGDASKPAAKPLQLYPFDSNVFLDQVSELAPAYSLNILLNAVLEDQLLKKYPFVQNLFLGLGLAQQADGTWQMPSLMGILRDPLGWLLSDSVLGYNGQFSVAALLRLLQGLPEVRSSNGITVTPKSNGVDISGLPYDFNVSAEGNNGIANFGFGTSSLPIAGGFATLSNLKFELQLDENYQPAVSGSLDISASKDLNIPFYVTAGYNKAFLLKIAQGTPEQPTGLAVQLLPFLGWGTLAEQASRMAAVYMVEQLTPQLLQKLADAGAKDFVDRLTTFGTQIQVDAFVRGLMDILTPANFASKTQRELLEMVEASALNWLQGLYGPDKVADTVQGIVTLLSGVLPGQLEADGGKVSYRPSDQIPITIKAGLNNDALLGLWADVELPGTELLKLDIAETGMGISGSGEISFNFGVHMLVAIEGSTGPALNLDYRAEKGFVLGFDPLGDASDFSKTSALSRELLPEFFPATDASSLADRFTSWLFAVIKDVLPRYVSTLVLNEDSVRTWLDSPIVTPQQGQTVPTPGLLLTASSVILLDQTSNKYSLNTVDKLLALTPQTFFGNFLQTLMKQEITLFTFGNKNQCSITIGPKKNQPDYYGLRLFAPDLELDIVPNLVLQVGNSDDAWISRSGGTPGDPGIGLYLPLEVSSTDFSADFTRINLVMDNVGFDFRGTNGKPLVDLTRFTIDKIEPRILLSIQLNGGNAPTVAFGAGVTLDRMGLSLAPNSMAPGSSSNPIASNLLGSGNDTDNDAANPPTNPTFSVSVAYCNNLWVDLKSDTGNGSEVIVPIQRSFGPLYVENLGLGWEQQQKVLDFLFSGNVNLAGLKASLTGLTVGVPVTTPTDFSAYTLDLQGIDVSFKGGAVTLEAGLVKTETPYLSYTGTAIIKATRFALSAIGSYAEVAVSNEPDADKVPSLFVFGVLNMPLGGPPAFFVTGIAAGFSYNRSLRIPAVEEVQNFPLVKGVTEGSFTAGEDPATALLKLSEVVTPEVGQYWIAAGLSFTSFQLINSSALLFVSFGKDFEMNLLGLSYASLPPMVTQDLALAYFELAIKASFKPSAGIVSAEAQLTPNSFVLSKDCKVTGGFAFYLWYKTITTADYTIPAGDFVISLGGYHPAFSKPVYYPDVPRLGMQWKMEVSVGKIGISGGAYFALCPTAVMAGGYINVVFEAGPLKAWLDAYANFLIEWQPFYFNVGIGVTIGASFGTTIAGVSVRISAELGAKLHLEGPPTHGSVEVDWYVISFTIPVGSGETATDDNNLDWEGFAQSFLPPPQTPESDSDKLQAATLDAQQPVQQVVKWKAESGLINDTDSRYLVQPVPFSLSVNTAIPVSNLSVTDSAFSEAGASVGVRPMGYSADLDAPLIVTLRDAAGNTIDPLSRQITLDILLNGVASAMWSKSALNRTVAPSSEDMVIADALCGMLFSASSYVITGNVPEFAIDELEYTKGNIKQLPFTVTPQYPAGTPYPDSDQNTAYRVIKSSIMEAAVAGRRNEVYAALRRANIHAPADPDLSVMASSAEMILQALPVIAPIDIYQDNEVHTTSRVLPMSGVSDQHLASPDQLAKQPELVALFKAYQVSHGGALALGTLPLHRNAVRGKWRLTSGLLKNSTAALHTALYANDTQKVLHDGSIVIWKIDHQAQTTLNTRGALLVNVFVFDPYHELISLQSVSEGAPALPLEIGAAEVVIQGVEKSEISTACGWQWNTRMAKVNASWAIGPGCMMRTQNMQRTAVDRQGNQIGTIDAGRLLDNNTVISAGNRRIPGWVESVFQSGISYVAVLLDGPDVTGEAVSVSIGINRRGTRDDIVQPIRSYTIDGHILLIYAVTAENQHSIAIHVHLKPLTSKGKIKGVYGLSADEFRSKDQTPQIQLAYCGLDIASSTLHSSTVTLATALNSH
ncbi:DUF6603 domain-containing protein [Parapedobacter indicus]|uniref:DUF6603 domain-containing protein n=1 Tax=Parapedobacter indicus TaxID=1477437 RepID=A0A1I3HN45_9SPHI|nr:DUF6603 domain-containing protein [Parapedobacter indicus]PPL03106.1 hypothetical protein CLV26_103432 [Parapedobacter indicus]SFI37198.1 hypothetical protein SAMN05444682_103431 [Parapedobacter indicus]